jgi:hypothetical protein
VYPATEFLSAGWPRWMLIAAYYGLLLATGRRLLAWASGSASRRCAILVGTMFYALSVPRLIIYSYMVAIVPVLALLLPSVRHAWWGRLAVVVALCVSGVGTLPSGAGKFLSDAAPLLLLWGAWLWLVALQKTDRVAEVP